MPEVAAEDGTPDVDVESVVKMLLDAPLVVVVLVESMVLVLAVVGASVDPVLTKAVVVIVEGAVVVVDGVVVVVVD